MIDQTERQLPADLSNMLKENSRKATLLRLQREKRFRQRTVLPKYKVDKTKPLAERKREDEEGEGGAEDRMKKVNGQARKREVGREIEK